MMREMTNNSTSMQKFNYKFTDHSVVLLPHRSGIYSRRRHERDIEMEEDERDRRREKDEIETLRLEVMEKQARDKLGGRGVMGDEGSSSESSPQREEEEEDMDVPVRHELEEDIPLTKTGYTVPASFTQIQVSLSEILDILVLFNMLFGYTCLKLRICRIAGKFGGLAVYITTAKLKSAKISYLHIYVWRSHTELPN